MAAYQPHPAASGNHAPGPGSSGPRRFYGKYRGTVLSNLDPMQKGRIQVQVPDVTELLPTTYAMPCVPVGGLAQGFLAIPPPQAGVWVEFEQGDPDFPIWTGCYWGNTGEVPPLAKMIPPGVGGFVMHTFTQTGLVISDLPAGGILLKAGLATITINESGIVIQNGKGASVALTANQVILNAGALVVQ